MQLTLSPEPCPCAALEELVLTYDELKAMRLADLEGLCQEDGCSPDADIPADLRQ